MKNLIWTGSALALCFFLGCGGNGAGADKDARATVDLTQVPQSVGCVVIHVQGVSRTVDRAFSAFSGQSSVYTLNGLQSGPATFTGFAYPFGTPCFTPIPAIVAPDYQSDPVAVTLTPGTSTPVTLVLRPVGSA